jgi:hypothetical protein
MYCPTKRVLGHVPELEKMGAVYKQWRGVLWRRQVFICFLS